MVGDALGSNYEGFSRGHISAVFSGTNEFKDPGPALKGKLKGWRMPGLYSSITQMMILHSYLLASGENPDRLFHIIAGSPELPDTDFGIFRNPGRGESELIKQSLGRKRTQPDQTAGSYPCPRLIPESVPAALYSKSVPDCIVRTSRFITCFTTDTGTAAGAILFTVLLHTLLSGDFTGEETLLSLCREVGTTVAETIRKKSDVIFDTGINPMTLEEKIYQYRAVLDTAAGESDLRAAEEAICRSVNPGLKNPIKRASVNVPEAIVPFAIASASRQTDADPITAAAAEGGESAVLTSMAGCLSAAWSKAREEHPLFSRLVNKKRLSHNAVTIASGVFTGDELDDFIESEASLTRKEIDDRNSRLKHEKKPERKRKKSDRERRNDLTRHIVESWTKADKARWKKEVDKKKKKKKRLGEEE